MAEQVTTEEARQAERKPGMILVLGISTITAAIVLGLIFVLFAS